MDPALPIGMRQQNGTRRDSSAVGRRHVGDSDFRSHVEGVVSSAAIWQRLQLCGFRALWPVAGAQLIEGRVVNTANAVDDKLSASPKFGRMRRTSSSLTIEAWMPSQIDAISPLVDWLMFLIERSRCAVGNETAVELALREALNNAVVHGNGMDPHKLVDVRCRCEWGKGVSLTVKDQGYGFDPNLVPDALAPDRLEAEHGRGLYLMRSLMDQVSFERGGTEVRMWKGAGAPAQPRRASKSKPIRRSSMPSGVLDQTEKPMAAVP